MAKKISKINISKLAGTIQDELKDYAYVAENVVRDAINETAKETAETIRAASPQRTGNYASSWTYGHGKKSNDKYTTTVYADAPGYRLAHLLEKGHAKVNGGRVAAIPHIQPAAASAVEILVNHIKEGLK